MIALIGALCSMLVFAGGYQSSTDILSGLLLTSFGVIGLGTIVAYLQDSQVVSGIDSREGLTVEQLFQYLTTGGVDGRIDGDTKIYVGDNGLNVAGAVFACILDGHRAVVIERKIESTGTAHDLF